MTAGAAWCIPSIRSTRCSTASSLDVAAARAEARAPRYQRIEAQSFRRSSEDASRIRVIAGELGSSKGPAQTLMPLFLWHASLPPAPVSRPRVDPAFEAAAYVIAGEGRFGGRAALRAGQLVIWAGAKARSHRESAKAPARGAVFGGAPAEGPLVFHGRSS
jgi:redox-sensitive bicupin YhaK (pirin superfamily)